MTIRFVGDVHGHHKSYWKVVRDVPWSVQVGDMGFSYGFFEHYGLDPVHHRFLGGNHDNYDVIGDCPNSLGDFGLIEVPGWEHGSFFFVRGAYSIDKAVRTPGRDWWHEEELDMASCYQAIEAYKAAKPSIMVTHDCPESVGQVLSDQGLGSNFLGKTTKISTRTGQMLQSMIECHQPETWIFGHWHVNFVRSCYGTSFVCLPELGYLDL